MELLVIYGSASGSSGKLRKFCANILFGTSKRKVSSSVSKMLYSVLKYRCSNQSSSTKAIVWKTRLHSKHLYQRFVCWQGMDNTPVGYSCCKPSRRFDSTAFYHEQIKRLWRSRKIHSRLLHWSERQGCGTGCTAFRTISATLWYLHDTPWKSKGTPPATWQNTSRLVCRYIQQCRIQSCSIRSRYIPARIYRMYRLGNTPQMRMEALVKFMTLRSLATKGKIAQAVDFIKTFLDSGKNWLCSARFMRL